MSALASLESFGEEDPFFHKLKIVQTLFTKWMAFSDFGLWKGRVRNTPVRDHYNTTPSKNGLYIIKESITLSHPDADNLMRSFNYPDLWIWICVNLRDWNNWVFDEIRILALKRKKYYESLKIKTKLFEKFNSAIWVAKFWREWYKIRHFGQNGTFKT